MEDIGEALVDNLFSVAKVINPVPAKNSSGEGTVIGCKDAKRKSVTVASCGANQNTKLTDMSISCGNEAHKKKITDHYYSFENFSALAEVVLRMKHAIERILYGVYLEQSS